MNTWRDIKTAPKHQPVLVTVEGMVCFGRFCDFEDEDYSGLAFDGACLSDGESVSYFADYIDGWQPAPATFQLEKSADQMFQELGFSKQTDAWGDLFYLHESGFRMVAFSRETFCAKVLLPSGWETVGMTKAETVACAQLIREMQNGSD